MNAAHWTGDEWRWNVDKHRDPTIYTVTVIDGAEEPPEKPGAKKVPFGFSPRDAEPETRPEPDEFIDWLDVIA